MNGLAEDYAGKLEFEVLPTTAEGSAERMKKYGFDVHGMVLTDQDDNVVWKEDGHKQKREGVQSAIDEALGG
ncbi:MAG: hypothetical protein AB8H80_12175 [Planctomycetota bacterium]